MTNRIYDKDNIYNKNDITKEELQETMYPGFAIKCLNCESERVVFDNSLGYSAESGGWGSLDLYCLDCKNNIEIYENF